MVIVLIVYKDALRVMSGEYEFGRWMFLPATNKTWLWVGSIGTIGGASVYISRKIGWKLKAKRSQ